MLRAEVKGQSAFHLAAASVFSLFIAMTPIHSPTTYWSALIHPPQEPLGLISQHHHLHHQWLDYLGGGLYLAAASDSRQPSIKKRKKNKKNKPLPVHQRLFEKTWFSRFIRCNKHDFILLALLIEMSCLFHKLETFYPPEPTLHQPTTDGIWWELAACPWCTPHFNYNLLAPSTKAPLKSQWILIFRWKENQSTELTLPL